MVAITCEFSDDLVAEQSPGAGTDQRVLGRRSVRPLRAGLKDECDRRRVSRLPRAERKGRATALSYRT
jgi:hypothetical protein